MVGGVTESILKRPITLEAHGVLEEPEADLGVAVDRESVGAKVDEPVACPGTRGGRIQGGERLDQVVLVGHTAVFPDPLGDVQLVLGTATRENARG